MTPEQQIQAIIEAQVKGGCRKFFPHSGELKGVKISKWGGVELREDLVGGTIWHVLQILLDPAGLKAAYEMLGVTLRNGKAVLAKVAVAHSILDTWLTSNGNPTATIQSAYDLLPLS